MYDDEFDLQFQYLASKPVPMSILRYFRCQSDMGKKERSYHIFPEKKVPKKRKKPSFPQEEPLYILPCVNRFCQKKGRPKFFKKEIFMCFQMIVTFWNVFSDVFMKYLPTHNLRKTLQVSFTAPKIKCADKQ